MFERDCTAEGIQKTTTMNPPLAARGIQNLDKRLLAVKNITETIHNRFLYILPASFRTSPTLVNVTTARYISKYYHQYLKLEIAVVLQNHLNTISSAILCS